jgi:hypothetical protein
VLESQRGEGSIIIARIEKWSLGNLSDGKRNIWGKNLPTGMKEAAELRAAMN